MDPAQSDVWEIEVSGPGEGIPAPPPELSVQIKSKSQAFGWDGEAFLTFVMSTPWSLVSDLAIGVLASWLYDTFRDRTESAPTGKGKVGTSERADTVINITIKGRNNSMLISNTSELAEMLKKLSDEDRP